MAESESKPKKVKARVLSKCIIEGREYHANDLVQGSADAIRRAESEGKVDTHKDAVAAVS